MQHESATREKCAQKQRTCTAQRVIADWKPRVDVWPRATRGAEADIGFYRLPGSRDTYVDAVCSLANPETYPGCEHTTGKVAEDKARDKNRDHPVFDRQTRRRMYSFDFRALSFERHGFWAKETVGFIKTLAHNRAASLGLEPSAEIRLSAISVSSVFENVRETLGR